jgi:hypothetical protein
VNTEGKALAAAIAAQGEGDGSGEPEQLDLLGLPAPATAAQRAELERFVAERRPGRPKGSRNRRVTQMVDYLLHQYADPRAVLLQIAQTDVGELIARLGCTPLEAIQEKRLAAIGVLPYVAQRQPLAIDVRNRSVVYLTINEGGQVAPTAGGVGLALNILDLAATTESEDSGAPAGEASDAG